MPSGARAARIEAALRERFAPLVLEIEDDSARHAGHAGASSAGETHFNVLIVADLFTNLKPVDRSRAVHSVLSSELQSGLHALSLKLRSPVEWSTEKL